MAAWSGRWPNGKQGPPIVPHHTDCGHQTEAKLVCAACGEALEHGSVRASLGPGYPARLRPQAEKLDRFTGPRRRCGDLEDTHCSYAKLAPQGGPSR